MPEGNAGSGSVIADVRNLVAGEYEPATVHEQKMPINIGRSAFPE
jgi:hypothetical protein